LATRPIFILIGIVIAASLHARAVQGQSSLPVLPQALEKSETKVPGNPPVQKDLDGVVRELKELRQAQPTTGGGREIDRLKEQVDLQQKQIDVLLKMTQLLADQLKKQPASGAAVDKLQEQVATQEASILRGAQRDKASLSNAHAAGAVRIALESLGDQHAVSRDERPDGSVEVFRSIVVAKSLAEASVGIGDVNCRNLVPQRSEIFWQGRRTN
jgi:hypothetical protein